jgi:hypothetical protein
MNSENLKVGQRVDLFCVDCGNYRWQKYKGIVYGDKSLLFQCEECGCENSENDEKEN